MLSSSLLLQKLTLLALFACLAGSGGAAGRELSFPLVPLEARLMREGGGGMVDCWNALLELRSCTNEIVLFFVNGESYLGLDCCRAIRVITRHCWTSMLTTLGFTMQESDILRGYCDAETAFATAAPPPAALLPPPTAAPVAEVVSHGDPMV